MEVLVLFFALISTCLALDIPLNINSYLDECAKENKIDISMYKLGQKPDPKLLKTRPYKCFGNCVSVKAGFVKANGEINADKMKSVLHLNNEAVDKITECGKANKQSDKCERSYAIKECIKKNVKGIFPV